ncbi:uncharacterized protein LOC124457888 [Xenia sp. Carnegie-2017]|uniref:uncharacterized protein LOC124457888 n=1 Tax=Xenia sp. Carnegie-2017 TaxID=2897299 RepID=UPI001F04BA96|nr:uncharacterized protein LOC124457888 [Xenia sp. Carnegie-2017]
MARRKEQEFKCINIHCSHLSFASFKRYMSHVRDYHVHEPNFKIKCPFDSCCRSYSLISSLTSHMRRKHKGDLDYAVDCEVNDMNGDITQDNDHLVADSTLDSIEIGCNNKYNTYISVKEMALFALKTQEFNQLGDTATDAVLENTYQLMEQNEDYFKKQVKLCIEHSSVDIKDIKCFEELLESPPSLSASKKVLQTSKDRNKYLRETLNMVDPIEIVLGEEVVTSEVNGQFRVKKHSFQYIPIIKVLEQLLNQIDIMSQVRNPHQSLETKARKV